MNRLNRLGGATAASMIVIAAIIAVMFLVGFEPTCNQTKHGPTIGHVIKIAGC